MSAEAPRGAPATPRADATIPFPPRERRGPPPGRGPTAADAYPFFFTEARDRDLARATRELSDATLLDEPEPETAEPSVAAGRAAVAAFARAGLLEAAVGPTDDARGRGSLRRCVFREEVAYASPLADAVLAVTGLGSQPLVLAKVRPDLLEAARAGAAVFGFAITEPDAGSDVSRIATAARREGDHYVLEGTKCFISNAGLATHFTLFARTGEGKKGVSCLLVPASAARFELTELNAAHPVGTLRFEGSRVPVEARLGEEGAGLSLALGTLDRFRPSVGAAAIGMGRRALDEALAHLEGRVQFGAPLAENAQLQALLAQAATDLEGARLLVYRAAWLADHGDGRATLESSMAKLAATEAAQKAIDLGVQLTGGLGVVRGRAVERLYRAIRALRIYEGASEVMRVVIARELRGRGRAPRA